MPVTGVVPQVPGPTCPWCSDWRLEGVDFSASNWSETSAAGAPVPLVDGDHGTEGPCSWVLAAEDT